ncbi:hypothetical protein CAPTEDRAFT_214825 [Capitella teleta]|uniref:Fucolectin tachylectin-4 pentraxin-1 domain-containing protein n=1 Tax=Capitella teleta TaxID=283909 RepID=R7V0X7_CAPTE|nr:hypothetical protein CAPTEDRAFT_214825 [Capitella teleta]|eukprot:ELU12498.1 hypothetical protein CAPTEDRAFT_214825 [Capitella teleta]
MAGSRCHPQWLTFLGLILIYFTDNYVECGCPNIATHKFAQQKTDFGGNNFTKASAAVDGVTNSDFQAQSCSCTATYGANADPWWALDLGQRMRIDRVVLHNRGDCCGERLHNIHVGISDSDPGVVDPNPSNYELIAYHNESAGAILTIDCNISAAMGRYLIIQIIGPDEVVTLCEVEVYEADACCMDFPIANMECKDCALGIQCPSTVLGLSKQCLTFDSFLPSVHRIPQHGWAFYRVAGYSGIRTTQCRSQETIDGFRIKSVGWQTE